MWLIERTFRRNVRNMRHTEKRSAAKFLTCDTSKELSAAKFPTCGTSEKTPGPGVALASRGPQFRNRSRRGFTVKLSAVIDEKRGFLIEINDGHRLISVLLKRLKDFVIKFSPRFLRESESFPQLSCSSLQDKQIGPEPSGEHRLS